MKNKHILDYRGGRSEYPIGTFLTMKNAMNWAREHAKGDYAIFITPTRYAERYTVLQLGEVEKIHLKQIKGKLIPCEGSSIIMRVSREYATKHGNRVFIAKDTEIGSYVTYFHTPQNRCPEPWKNHPSFNHAKLELIKLREMK